jgi:hypothetical protein
MALQAYASTFGSVDMCGLGIADREGVAEQPEQGAPDAEIDDVLEGDVDAVL